MRFLAKVFIFSFSLGHRLAMVVIGAHVILLRNLFSRLPDAARPRTVKRA